MLKANERIDDLFKENLKIIQNDDVFFIFNRCFIVRAFYRSEEE